MGPISPLHGHPLWRLGPPRRAAQSSAARPRHGDAPKSPPTTQRAGRDLVTPLAARALHHWSWGVWLYLGNGNCYSTHETHSFRAERDAWSTSFHARHAVGLSWDIECDTTACLSTASARVKRGRERESERWRGVQDMDVEESGRCRATPRGAALRAVARLPTGARARTAASRWAAPGTLSRHP